jgi:hypothetical protein
MTTNNRVWKVGDEVDFYCRRCRLNLYGNVASIVDGQVKTVTCRTCRGTQPYAREKTEEEIRAGQLKRAFQLRDRRHQQFAEMAASRKTAASGTEVTRRWREATEDVDARYAPRYDPRSSYEVEDLVIHPQHGLGVVTQVVHENAFVALFRKVELPLEMGASPEEEE